MSDQIGIWINVVLVMITGVYAFFTYRILEANRLVANEMALQRRNQLRPLISVGPEFDEYLVASLVIRNSGLSPAQNLQLSVDKDFYPFAETNQRNIKEYSVFNKPISQFAPGAILRFDLAQGFNLGKSSKEGQLLTPLEFTIHARYEYLTETHNDEFTIDLRPYFNSTNRRSRQLDELENIRKALESIAKTLR